jgi:hypothetical protein
MSCIEKLEFERPSLRRVGKGGNALSAKALAAAAALDLACHLSRLGLQQVKLGRRA